MKLTKQNYIFVNLCVVISPINIALRNLVLSTLIYEVGINFQLLKLNHTLHIYIYILYIYTYAYT